MTAEDKYKKANCERKKHTDAVLNSTSNKRIIVAGPGTGKTYLFKLALEGKTNALTLTFVNSLVEDLSLELYGMSDVKTLHSFARSELSKALKDEVKLYPKLSAVIRKDHKILEASDIDFDAIFHNRDDENEKISFYKDRKDYYDKYYGYSDVIFGIVKYFESKKDKIPSYELVVVDEFQDFNKLEVSLIELLAEKNSVLIAGDDDQALYAFKDATPEHIRHRHSDKSPDYDSFTLPYCSRCSRVIVEATNDIIKSSISNGLLEGRIDKSYLYFDDEKKDKVSDANPKLIYKQCYDKQMGWFIEQQISEIAKEVQGDFSVLVISPFKKQSQSVVQSLKKKGFENISYVEKNNSNEPSLMDGLKMLIGNAKSNLGWRIVAEHFLSPEDFKNLIEKTKDRTKTISDLLEKDLKDEVGEILKVLRAINNDNDVDEDKLISALEKANFDRKDILRGFLKEEIEKSSTKAGIPAIRKVPIKATTIQSSKGLASDYVFITHFDDQYFIKDGKKVTDQEACNFLVALTRAKKKIFFISSKNTEPVFLKWIDDSRIEKI